MFRFSLKEQLATWYKYITRQNLQPDVDPLIANSWKRCLPRLNPHQDVVLKRLSDEHLHATLNTNIELLSIARPIMEDIYQFIENSHTVVVLVNSAGYILDLLGDAAMAISAARVSIREGVSISENHMGTNAFALALIERVPAFVVGPDHFLEKFHALADAAAPIFEPTGRPLGALGVLTETSHFHRHTLGVVVAGARAIEGQKQSDLLLEERISQLAELNAVLTTISDGILVWNENGVLIHANAAASRIIGRPLRRMVGEVIEMVLGFPDFVLEALNAQRPLDDVDAHLTVGDLPVNCLVSLRFASGPRDARWVIMTLREAESVRRLIHHQIGPQISVKIEDFAGDSPQIRQLRNQARTAAPAKASILVRGESGTGKDYLAHAIHHASLRRNAPFVIFSCASVPAELVLGELLGDETGVSVGGSGGRPSKFELAHRGTLFFQDIEVLPMEGQALLLNVLELSIIQRLGSSRPVEVDVRVVASTTANLEQRVAEGSFRADLFYRLSPFEIVMPPLRKRRGDIPQLVERILARLSRQLGRPLALAPGVLPALERYHWPGNIRELEAVLDRAAIQAGASELIGEMHFPAFVRHPANLPTQTERLGEVPTLEAMEREAIIHAARMCKGNVSQMAKVLGIGRTTVWRKLRDLNISADSFRQ